MTAGRVLDSDAHLVGIYILASFVLGAVLTPPLYAAGKALAAHVALTDAGVVLEWLGAAADRARFPRYFKRALALAALLLLPLLIWRLRRSRPRYPGQSLRKNPYRWTDLALGFVIAAGGLLALGGALLALGWFGLEPSPDWPRALRSALVPAVSVALLEEIFFRGLLLGIFLRFLKPWTAIVYLSALFAALHFLLPQRGLAVADPHSPWAGFEYLGLLLDGFTDPTALLAEFLTLFGVGVILALARWRTASLWLAIGLHAGWVFAFKLYHRITVENDALPAGKALYIGDDLKEGLLPLAVLVLSGLVVYRLSAGRGHQP